MKHVKKAGLMLAVVTFTLTLTAASPVRAVMARPLPDHAIIPPPGYIATGQIRSAVNPDYCLTASFDAGDGTTVYVMPCLPAGKDALQVWSANRVLNAGYITLVSRSHLVLGQKGSAFAKTIDFTKEQKGYTSTIHYSETDDEFWQLSLPYFRKNQLTAPGRLVTGKGTSEASWSPQVNITARQRLWIFPAWEEVSD
jgi:hypothetical protein